MKIQLENLHKVISKLTSGKNEKPKRGFLKWKAMSINGFPIQILLPKSKKERTEVISRLLSLLLHTNYKNIWNFLLDFKTCFTIVMSRV